jgi:hypothetical protein
MLVALPARPAVPLVVGEVRDQRGAAIADATVMARRDAAPPLWTRTDAAGSFSIAAAGIVAVVVACRYCAQTTIAVRPGEPVVAIVRRYQALAAGTPTSGDLENLPYAHVESSIALRPFTLLAQSSAAYPGPTLSDRGLSQSGSLLIDDGAPNYDVVSGSSPYELVPAQYERSATLQDASNAFLYGDQAAGGIVDASPVASGSNWEVATLGSDAIARAQVGSDALGAVAGTFSNDEESRQRADVFANWSPAGDGSLSLAAGTEQGRTYESPASAFAGSFSFATVTYDEPSLENLYVSAEMDRGGYVLGSEYPTYAQWADSNALVGVHSTGPVAAFADVGVRASSGYYDEEAYYAPPEIGATLIQTRADAGLVAAGTDYNLVAGVGAFWIDYGGGTYGVSTPARTALAVPSLQATLFPAGRWSINLQGSGSFTLPTFVEQYGNQYSTPTSVQDDRNELLGGSLTYTDQSRLRVTFEEASQRVAGAQSGTIVSTGFAATWQIAPAIALRAWTMHVNDTLAPYAASPYAADGSAPTVDALWLTYEGTSGVRFDAIYRRDLLDGAPFYHVDGDLSGPLADPLRWYAGVEDRQRRTFLDIGLRFGGQ